MDMRITFVLPFAGLAGGMRVIAIYADRLKRRGHDVFLVSTPPDIPLRRKVKSLVLGQGWPGRHTEPSHFDGLVVPHRILESVRPVVDADVPDSDVVIATYYTTVSGVLRLSSRKGAKAIFIQNYEVEEGKTNRALDLTWCMPMHKITISKWLVELATTRFHDPVVSHIPNSVDLEQFHADVRAKAGRPTVGLLYNSFSLKGLTTSLKALKRISETIPSLRVISFGAEQPRFSLPLPPCADYVYRPPQASLRELYSQCDVWMCGSNVEGFHLPPLEAMACRCPVVSTKVGGPMDIVEDGVNGYLVQVKDDRSLAERTTHVLELPDDQWRCMSDAAYRTAVRYTWDDATTLFEGALETAVARSKDSQLSWTTDVRP